jgi:hypothetical protein
MDKTRFASAGLVEGRDHGGVMYCSISAIASGDLELLVLNWVEGWRMENGIYEVE